MGKSPHSKGNSLMGGLGKQCFLLYWDAVDIPILLQASQKPQSEKQIQKGVDLNSELTITQTRSCKPPPRSCHMGI